MVFNGFPSETITFLGELAQNNNSGWFNENKDRYEKYFKRVAFDFINAIGPELQKLLPGLEYEAKVNRSLFKLNKDVRFSKDKLPYKTHMGVVFWKGPFSERQYNPGFYFQLESNKLFIASGSWMFTKEVLAEYRESLLEPKRVKEFLKIADKLENQGIKLTSDDKLVKYPKGFSEGMPAAEYSKYKGLYSYIEEFSLPDIVYKKEIIDYVMAFYSKTADYVEWAADLASRAVNKNK